jgi:predicted PhzF superfamily epimerase YddE/YHI9
MFQVDAFADRVFEGNPAAIVPLDSWLDDSLMQSIAEENNLSETAFLVPAVDRRPENGRAQRGPTARPASLSPDQRSTINDQRPAREAFELRWFTPGGEVDLCGHATLASAHVVYEHLGHARPEVRFLTRSGELTVMRRDGGLTMDFPAAAPTRVDAPAALLRGLGGKPTEILAAFDYVAVFETEDDVRALAPDFALLKTVDLRGVVATAPGREVDFVSRCFYPKLRVDEDPVTGSAHCEMAPYWAARVGRSALRARQVSKRGGSLTCEIRGDRVLLSGNAVDFMTAEISV